MIHPLKAGQCKKVETVHCGPRGPSNGTYVDRSFMVVTEGELLLLTNFIDLDKFIVLKSELTH